MSKSKRKFELEVRLKVETERSLFPSRKGFGIKVAVSAL